MELIPVIAVAVVGAVGFCLMLAAFVVVGRRGGWQQAMRPTPEAPWPLPRRLMVIGAALGVLFGVSVVVLSLIPGGIPWQH
jgi:hypothetical protein